MNGRRRRNSRRVLAIVGVAIIALLGFGGTVAVQGGGGQAAAQAACSAPAWSSGATYNVGAVVSHNGHEWRATQWMWPGLEPGNSGVPPYWLPWSDLGACGSQGTTTTMPSSTTTSTGPGSTTTTTPSQSGFPVEDRYEVAGPYAVSVDATSNPGYKVHRPTTLSTTYKHPILTWASGTNGTCGGSATQLNHLASWGYVVVCWESGQTAQGVGVWQGAQWMIAQNTMAGSPYFGKLDTAKVGAFGHSQGAEGAVRATMLSNGVITSTVALSFVDPIWFYPGSPPDLSQLRAPVFFVAGSNDFLCSPDQQIAYYNQVTNAPAVKASRIGSDHSTTIPDPGRSGLAYVTAWFKYTLEGDTQARSAFVTVNGVQPEIARNTTKWERTAFKNLP